MRERAENVYHQLEISSFIIYYLPVNTRYFLVHSPNGHSTEAYRYVNKRNDKIEGKGRALLAIKASKS